MTHFTVTILFHDKYEPAVTYDCVTGIESLDKDIIRLAFNGPAYLEVLNVRQILLYDISA